MWFEEIVDDRWTDRQTDDRQTSITIVHHEYVVLISAKNGVAMLYMAHSAHFFFNLIFNISMKDI